MSKFHWKMFLVSDYSYGNRNSKIANDISFNFFELNIILLLEKS